MFTLEMVIQEGGSIANRNIQIRFVGILQVSMLRGDKVLSQDDAIVLSHNRLHHGVGATAASS